MMEQINRMLCYAILSAAIEAAKFPVTEYARFFNLLCYTRRSI